MYKDLFTPPELLERMRSDFVFLGKEKHSGFIREIVSPPREGHHLNGAATNTSFSSRNPFSHSQRNYYNNNTNNLSNNNLNLNLTNGGAFGRSINGSVNQTSTSFVRSSPNNNNNLCNNSTSFACDIDVDRVYSHLFTNWDLLFGRVQPVEKRSY
jgi:hypothetical protein